MSYADTSSASSIPRISMSVCTTDAATTSRFLPSSRRGIGATALLDTPGINRGVSISLPASEIVRLRASKKRLAVHARKADSTRRDPCLAAVSQLDRHVQPAGHLIYLRLGHGHEWHSHYKFAACVEVKGLLHQFDEFNAAVAVWSA